MTKEHKRKLIAGRKKYWKAYRQNGKGHTQPSLVGPYCTWCGSKIGGK